jgi:hypothetical protein
VVAGELRLSLWGDVGMADERAGWELVRVQTMLGSGEVGTAVLVGGRDPAERVRLVPWGDDRGVAEHGVVRLGESAPPWPGRLPAPSPITVPPTPVPAEVLDARGCPVAVTDRAVLSAAPALVGTGGGRPAPVLGWAGPWAVDQRWWDAATGWRGCRLQVVLAGDQGGVPTALPERGMGRRRRIRLTGPGQTCVRTLISNLCSTKRLHGRLPRGLHSLLARCIRCSPTTRGGRSPSTPAECSSGAARPVSATCTPQTGGKGHPRGPDRASRTAPREYARR